MSATLGILLLLMLTLPSAVWEPDSLAICQDIGCVTTINVECTTLGSYPALQITYQNNADGRVMAITFDVIRNSTDGVVMYYSTATTSIGAGAVGFAFPIEYGLPHGNYSETIITTGDDGAEISPMTSIQCAV